MNETREAPSGAPVCLMCNGSSKGPTFPYGTIWNGQRFDYLACSGCGSSFLHPLPTATQIAAMYCKSQYHDEHYTELDGTGLGTSLAVVRQMLPPDARILDYGCGNGAFLLAAKDAGYCPEGVEVDPGTIAAAAAATGCRVFSPEELELSGQMFDAIHLGDVLEHLTDPAEQMQRLERILKPGGFFFVEGPLENNSSLVLASARSFARVKLLAVRRVLGDQPPFHISRSTARAQRDFFRKRLGYRERYFSVFENGWPYSSGRGLRRLIGRVAVVAAKMGEFAGLELGNRFVAIVEPQR